MKSSNKKLAYWEGGLSIGINTILFGFKYWAGIATGSVAIIADGWHTLSDSITSIIVIAGTKIGSKPPDTRHAFGHGRAEFIASLVIGVLLAVVGFNFAVEAVKKLWNHLAADFSVSSAVIFGCSIVLKEGLAEFSLWAGRKTGMHTLKADGWHHRSDAIASAVILAGIFLGPLWWWIDGVLGITVSLLIFYAAFEIVREAVNHLMGQAPTDETISRIKVITKRIAPETEDIHHIHIHQYGSSHTEITFHTRFSREAEIGRIHQLVTCIEKAIYDEMGMQSNIHIEPLSEGK